MYFNFFKYLPLWTLRVPTRYRAPSSQNLQFHNSISIKNLKLEWSFFNLNYNKKKNVSDNLYFQENLKSLLIIFQ